MSQDIAASTSADAGLRRAHPLLLPALMVGGVTLGAAIGGFWAESWNTKDFAAVRGFFKLIGEVFLNMLNMLVVPLIVFSVMYAMAGLGDIRRAGRLFVMTMAYFVITMMMAVTLGMTLVNA